MTSLIDNIPPEVKALRQWVMWKREMRAGKLTKVPYQVTGTRAASNAPATWTTFEAALAAAPAFDGIGVVFANGLVGVDLDHHIEGGEVSPYARTVVAQMNSYTERSPSGTGLHVLAFGTLPPGGRVKHECGIEMYGDRRFFTMTGMHLEGTPLTVNERTPELAQLHRETFGEYKPPPPAQPSQPNNLDDQELLTRARRAKNGAKFERLYAGNWQGYPSQSEADMGLCSILAFWTGGDTARIDRIFRTSGLMRKDWDEPHNADGDTYGEMTIARGMEGTELYKPMTQTINPDEMDIQEPEFPPLEDVYHRGRPGAAPVQNRGYKMALHENKQTAEHTDQPAPKERRDPKGFEYVNFLASQGYAFRLCELDDSLWVNGERMTDSFEAEIRTVLRDNGYGKVNVAADAYLAHARANSFHPVKNFLRGLEWDGQDHIGKLASYFTDKHGAFGLALRKFVTGAVARPMTGGKQNRVLVIEGGQGLGKSFFARWLGSPIESHFSEAMPDPDNKDSRLALATVWIWEIKELGSVTRRADRESLKAWLTLETVTERMPFGKFPIYKPAMTSFIATVNDEGGFFTDPTGSRRYMTVAVKSIDWQYARQVDIKQVWAQAVALFDGGEDWNLNKDEQKLFASINDEYEFSVPSHDWLDRYIQECPDGFLEFDAIKQAMGQTSDIRVDNHTSREIAGWMKKHGFEPTRQYVNVSVTSAAGNPENVSRRVRGYTGVRIAKRPTPAMMAGDL